jgi:hypothetical protein
MTKRGRTVPIMMKRGRAVPIMTKHGAPRADHDELQVISS